MGIEKSNIEKFKKTKDNIFVSGIFNKCNSCPCFDSNSDWGESCNFDFFHQDVSIKNNFYHLSKDCTINHVVGFNDQGDRVKEFYIDKVIIEEEEIREQVTKEFSFIDFYIWNYCNNQYLKLGYLNEKEVVINPSKKVLSLKMEATVFTTEKELALFFTYDCMHKGRIILNEETFDFGFYFTNYSTHSKCTFDFKIVEVYSEGYVST